jgi:predicted peptidase
MKTIAFLLSALSLLAFTSCAAMKSKPQTDTLSSGILKWRVSQTVELPYLYYVPKEYDPKSGKTWPLMLFLHGAGERGTNVERVAIHGPLSMVKKGKEFPFIIAAPLCPSDEEWSNEPLLKLLDHVTTRYAVDTNRVYVTGLSMGGYGTWNLALRYPEKFAAIAPICGGGSFITVGLAKHYATNKLAAMKMLGIWAFHGAKDPTVPPEESERMINILKKAGCEDVKLTVYPEAQHNSWAQTYNNPELYEWLLRHERKPAAASKR